MTSTAAPPAQNAHQDRLDAARRIGDQVLDVLAGFPAVELAILFGSVAQGRQRPDSDIDIAVDAGQVLTAASKIALIEALAERTGRPIDLIDLKSVAEPLLGQIVRHGRRLQGSDAAHGQLISRHLFEQADFMPYRSRILSERRAAWIGT
jgi:predicted nucleotidyltransferase